MIEKIRIVFRKEIRDNLRDRRALSSALFYPLLGPLIFGVMINVIGKVQTKESEKTLTLAVAGAEHAPNLVAFLEENDVEIEPASPEARQEVRDGDREVLLEIPPTFGEDLAKGRPATVRLVLDRSRQSAQVAQERVRSLLHDYSRKIGVLRLVARGVSPQILRALAIEEHDLATPQSRAAGFLSNMMPYFIIFSVFLGGLYIAIDTTTGERERGSLEPLLINPVSRAQLVLGKMFAIWLFTAVAVVETLLGFMVVLHNVSLEDLGLRMVNFKPEMMFKIFLLTLPIMVLAIALQMLIATFTRSFKEAQTYLSILPLVPALPSLFLSFMPVKTKLWMMTIPTFGQQLLINQLMREEPIRPLHVVLSAVVTFLCGCLLVHLVIRLYHREQVVFGR